MPDAALSGTALRYAAGDLSSAEATAFESRLADDQAARDALAEAVRLSAAAVGQKPPAPHPLFRAVIRARLNFGTSRGHPFAWIGLGGAVVAACTLVGLWLADRAGAPAGATVKPAPPADVTSATRIESPAAVAPMPRESDRSTAEQADPAGGTRSVAEIWADLSTPEHLERAHDDELRWRQHVRALSPPNHVSATARAAGVADAARP